MKRLLFFALCLCCLVTACSEVTTDRFFAPDPDCGPAIETVDKLDEPASDPYGITAARVEGMCLTVTLTATACSADGWTARLITDGAVAESLPTQSAARILLDDGVPAGSFVCQAEMSREFSFDLTPYLGNSGSLPSRLRLRGSDWVLEVE